MRIIDIGARRLNDAGGAVPPTSDGAADEDGPARSAALKSQWHTWLDWVDHG
jgi:hypothetical protein